MKTPEAPKEVSLSVRWAALILAAATLAVFGSFLNPKTNQVLSLLGEDLSGQFVWWRQFGFDQLRQGHLALWNPHLFSGAPFFGGFQSALLYPPNWFFLVLPLAFAINLSIALHVFGAGFFTFLWTRAQGLHPAACLLAAFMFMLGGSFFLHVVPGHLPNLCTMAWIPLVFLALNGWAKDRSLPWIALGILAFSMQILAGHIQYFYYTLLVAGLYLLAQIPGAARKISYLAGPTAMLGGAALLTAAQLAAGWEATNESVRGQALPLNLIMSNDLMPERIWSWWLPSFYGSAVTRDYWGGGMYWEGSLFASVAGMSLALYGLFAARGQGAKRFLAAGLGLFFLLLAMGKRTPLYMLFYHWVPLFDAFRGAAKFNILISLWICFLAAAGLDHYLKNPGTGRGFSRWVLGFALLAMGLAGLFYFAPALGLGKLYGKFGPHAPGMVWSLWLCALSLAATALAAWAGSKKSSLKYSLLLLAFLELFIFARMNRGGFDLPALENKAAQIQKVYDQDPGDYRVTAEPTNDTLGTKGLDVWGNDPMIPGRYALFLAQSQGLDVGNHFVDKPFFRSFPPVLGLTRIRYVFKDQGDSFRVQKLRLQEQPRFSLVGGWKMIPDADVFQRLSDPRFDPRREALVASDPGFKPARSKIKGQVRAQDLSTDEIEIEAQNDKPCLLVVGDNYAKGWRVVASAGDAQGIYRVMPVNFFERGISLQPGSHHFVLEYLPRFFVAAKWISLISLGFYLLFGLCIFYRPSRKPRV